MEVSPQQVTQQQIQAALAQGQRQGYPGISNLAKAFVAAWGEIPAVVEKDANNPHFGNDYATLEAVEKLVKPILAKHGLAFLQTPGAIEGERIEVVGLLLHESGEQIALRMHMPAGKLTAQAAGSAVTYARRYQLMAVFGLAPTDDDGEAASSPAPAPKAKKAKAEKSGSYADDKEALVEAINGFTGSVDELEKKIRPRVEELGDADVNGVYVEKRRQLKAAAKGK